MESGRLVQQRGADFLAERLLDPHLSISERFRALFALRNHRGEPARSALTSAMRDSSNLLAHEAAFALGQMQDAASIPSLRVILSDVNGCHPIVRHEAAEALGAIGDATCVAILEDAHRSDPAREVRETCELALHRISSQGLNEGKLASPFLSVDPAVAAPDDVSTSSLCELLVDEQASMHERYAALFALRNRGTEEAVGGVVATLNSSQSALLKHEIAYVLGQLQDKQTMEALVAVLEDAGEHPMVRHEAAEALGSIGDSRCLELLNKFSSDPEPLVRQSCEVALSMLHFEQAGKPFEYLYQELSSTIA